MSNRDKKTEEEYVFEIYEESQNSLSSCIEFIEKYKKGYFENDSPYIMGPEEKPFKISNDRIFPLLHCKSSTNIGFVDGGNAPIIKSADFNISFHRVAGAIFQSSTPIDLKNMPELIEFYTGTILTPNDEELLEYRTKFFPLNVKDEIFLPQEEIVINSKDESIRRGRFLPKIERFGSIARRFAEWTYGRELINRELKEGDIFLKDGSLQTGFTGEIKLAEQLYKEALYRKVIVSGLSKTCRLPTLKGDSLISIINFIGNKKYPENEWYYHPIYKITSADNQADIYFVKLHRHSSYPFRFDIYLKQSEELNKQERENIISNIASNSKDLSFPGYPYGLIKVDQMSRVAFRELETHKIMLLSEFDKEYYQKYILPRLRSVDAHDILNKIRK